MTTVEASQPIIAVDTREQWPYCFPHSVVKTLATGDYSVVGLEDLVVVERKTASDAYSSLGRERGRFRREFERLREFDYAAVVVEATLPGFLLRPPFSQMSPTAAVTTLLAWSVKYGVHVFFAGDRRHGNALTRCVLGKYWRYHQHLGHGDRLPSEAAEAMIAGASTS